MYETIKKIRLDKGMSQKDASKGYLSQSNYSKFENGIIDIPITAFQGVLSNLHMTLEEVLYIQNDYTYSTAEQLFREFFTTPVHNLTSLNRLIDKCEVYLEKTNDAFIDLICNVCHVLKENILQDDIYSARTKAKFLLQHFNKRDTLYEKDIYLISTVFFLFPLETARLTIEYVENAIERYGEFNAVRKIYANLYTNYGLMLMKEGFYKDAISAFEKALPVIQKYKLTIQLGVVYTRIGICATNLNIPLYSDYINKGVQILEITEEVEIAQIMKEEIAKYLNVTRAPSLISQ